MGVSGLLISFNAKPKASIGGISDAFGLALNEEGLDAIKSTAR
jgi:hypothetical protein